MAQQKPIISTAFNYQTLEEKLDIKPKGAQLHIGIPKETAFQENRISLTPEAVGVHMIGPMVSELIAEAADAMEFGASSEDIARICHAHPTLSEATKEAALAVLGRTLNF